MQLTFLFIKLPLAPNTRLTSPDQNFLAEYFKVMKYYQLLDQELIFTASIVYIWRLPYICLSPHWNKGEILVKITNNQALCHNQHILCIQQY